ncbi:Enoyl-CoA hydratase / 3-hydroxyacyl-CoA dehydrogenase / 3-hydroxybutyryl-CoA epimerase [Aequoribacter fuscus]|uniref:Enoyl-CoA hydratase / 3-hydroxyacyl-CoA dehydrogenase / 3-hydroxybutyryl-CoA epimerase n=2 Tax=Aequoribacter TaxID=2847769 RepID=F3L5A1_9GAMM|nr:3-hydroxyacyl-CoA dehydrogenase NAD-binding domain-containing protein [Aequoribacter fuscus]EGG28493.1 Enoyl-CoA hydratase / 3-hydroxyacyl-CoA dehydrogenase / 3-hydroxybutyryl-CoA epimerase [Aequoribacter fuscus]QHJ88588.1 3-hydroxyacyl-CoA dehydrogenase [Aequoribacter fuscus]
MSVFHYDKDDAGIVTVTMDMTGPVNAMNAEYQTAMTETVERLEAEPDLRGVVFASAKKVFFAGGDLNDLVKVQPEEVEQFFQGLQATKAVLRRIEKLPVPVAAAINGAALGGGFEIALCCNYRVAWNDRSVQLGLPEVTLGLLPGGGGVVRMTRLLGLAAALPYLTEGTRVTPDKALAAGMIHATVDTLEELVPNAKAWILAQEDIQAAATQPWDTKGYKVPGGGINSPGVSQLVMIAPAMLYSKTRGLLPAPARILDCAVEALRLDFDEALTVESRGLANLVITPVAKNMISTFFFGLNKINGGASRPKGVEKRPTQKVGVLGAGMMGQGIAYSSAMAGIQVVLKDISVEAAEKGKAYTEKLLAKRVAKGRMTEEKKQAVLDLILPTASNEDLQGCDLIIEAVFENMKLKHQITAELEGYLTEDGVWGSNTSTLPITQLADGSSKPENFIGIHFFSPVDKMPLVEIICGEKTSDEALAKAFDYTVQIKKTPIVVNDSLGFFTSRTFGTYLDEGVRLLDEGLHPVKIDNLGKAVGMPVGPLAVYDEVSMELSRKANATWEEMGVVDKWGDGSVARKVVGIMIDEHGRGGRYHGGGFYQYHEDGSKEIWSGLYDIFYKPEFSIDDQEVKDRLLFRQVIEALKCLESGVLRSEEDGNIGSIMGIGAPPWTGGLLQFVKTYGYGNFVSRCEALAAQYGDRFNPPQIAKDRA